MKDEDGQIDVEKDSWAGNSRYKDHEENNPTAVNEQCFNTVGEIENNFV